MKKLPIQVCPSILSGDFGHLSEEAKRLEEAGADAIHVDVMDGHFVPNLTLGPRALSAIRKATRLFLDVHIMIYNPFDYVEVFVQSGADRITFHFEATEDVEDTLLFIRKCGAKAGLAFRPETSFSMVPKYVGMCDLILFMTVSPGFGGQKFMSEVIEKVRLTRTLCEQHGIQQSGLIRREGLSLPPFDIQVDGGINLQTAPIAIKAGANVLVSGDFLFSQSNMKKAIEQLRTCCL